jgi:hypothetical protein
MKYMRLDTKQKVKLNVAMQIKAALLSYSDFDCMLRKI